MASKQKWYRAPGRVNLIGEHTDYNDGLVMPAAIALSAWVEYTPRDDRRLLVRSTQFEDVVEIDLDRPPSRPIRWGRDVCTAGKVGAKGCEIPKGSPPPATKAARPQRGAAPVLGLRGPQAGASISGTRAAGALGPAPTFEARHWGNALRGIAALLEESGTRLHGGDVLIRSEVPMGAGLSSSAAAEVAFGYALAAEAGGIDRTELALLCQRANHLYTGIRCGIMDQYIACHGRRGFALMLDTRDLTSTPLPLPDTLRLVVCDTLVRHDHASGEYNRRRAECEAGVEILSRRKPSLKSLRDATLEDLDLSADDLGPVRLRRCRHVVTENARVLAAADALKQKDFGRLGLLLAESHASLRDDYEVSCRELDIMCELASGLEDVVGARMTGGGFGGSVLALVRPEFVDAVRERLAESYRSATGIAPEIRAFTTANGAEASANPPSSPL